MLLQAQSAGYRQLHADNLFTGLAGRGEGWGPGGAHKVLGEMTPTGWPCSSATPCPGGGAPARVQCAGPARQERGPGAQEGDKSEEHSGRLVAARMRAAGRRGEATV